MVLASEDLSQKAEKVSGPQNMMKREIMVRKRFFTQHQRAILGIVLAFEVPEEQMLGPDIKPAGVLGGVCIADRVTLISDADRMLGRVFAREHLESRMRGLVV